jgi:hypothetical protein
MSNENDIISYRMTAWFRTTDASIPEMAIQAGYEADGRPLYIAPASMHGVMTPGKCGVIFLGPIFHIMEVK